MRKHLSRVMAALLVLAMALTMLPVVSAAKERFTATPIDGIPESGQTFVIYSAPAGGVFSPEASGGAVGVSAASGSEESANLTVQTGAGAYQAVKNADGTYYLTCGGQYLTVDSAEKLTFENEPKSGSSMSSKWKIADAGKDYDGFSIASAEVKYNNYEIFLEFYTSFKAWTYNPNKNDWSIYVFRFFSVDGTADPDNDGYIGTRPEAGELPKDGQTVVIYNDNAGAVMGPQTDDTTAPSLTGVEATPKGSGIEVGNGGTPTAPSTRSKIRASSCARPRTSPTARTQSACTSTPSRATTPSGRSRRSRRATSSITRRQSTITKRCASSTSATASAAGPTTAASSCLP